MQLVRRLSVLIALVLGLGMMTAVTTTAGAASDDSPFTRLRGFDLAGPDVRVSPKDYVASRVDLAALRAQLPGAGGSTVVSLPTPSGRLERFRVERTTVMESALAAAHPEISTYAGRGLDDVRATVALDITPMGFHASVRGPNGQRAWYVDPAYNGRGTTEHLSYYGAALPAPERRRAEGETQAIRETVEAKQAADAKAGQPVQRRIYRLALTSDPSYAAYFGTANVLSEKVTLINRVNQIYNDDMAIALRLVNGTDLLNLDTDAKATGANGPCGAAPCFLPATPTTDGELDFCDVPTLGKNRTVLGQLIGASNYDVGHIALGVNGGGIAYLGVTGGDYKGGGCTGLPQPKGDFFAIDYVAHEMGHQFGGDHTFNGTQLNCSGTNREQSASVEPGSGSSVMAYAGICRQDNLQPHSDPYFSHHTIDQFTALAESAPYPNIEVQTVSLRGFDTNGDSFQIGSGATTATLTRGSTYTAAGIEAAVQQVTGLDVSIAQWGFDEFGYDPTVLAPDDTGFQVIFNDEPSVDGAGATDVDRAALTVSGSSAGVSGFVGETARGGPSQNGGSTVQPAGNTAPVATAPADKTLPLRTPFSLTASGSDADGNPLTYLWEQNDRGGATGTALVSNTKAQGPLFRVFGVAADVSPQDTLKSPSPGENLADGSPTRVFPDLAQVLAGNTNAASGVCPTAPPTPTPLSAAQRECFSEFLPTAGYVGTAGSTTPAMHFRVTARDGFVNGGGTAYDDVTLTLDPTTGPFLVTSQATGSAVTGGAAAPVTWAVNGTQKLAANVRISLSTDGGATFGTVLAASTPNDGAQTLTMPNIDTTKARIKIEAVDNYFFDVNDAAFRITADPNAPNTSLTSGPKPHGFEPDRKVAIAYTSTEAGSTYVCTLDATPLTCGAGRVTVTVKPGTHTFSVAAVDGSGNTDATPASVTWARPLDDRVFTRSGFAKEKAKGAYERTYVEASRRGAELTEKIKKATKVALVVGTGKGYGRVTVYLGKKKLRVVDLAAKKTRFGVIVKVASFKKPASGVLRVRTDSGRTVRIDGLGVLTD
jgi:Metallo-peptidase family M12B Reprolysin-like